MEERRIDEERIRGFESFLKREERSAATVEKYRRDVRRLAEYIGGGEISKSAVLSYKEVLCEHYAKVSANSMLAAINAFFRFCGWLDLCVKQFKLQKRAFLPAERELTKDDYQRLVHAAEQKNNERLSLVIQTICGTGIRVSELEGVTVEAVQRGQTTVSCKGKTRTVFIVSSLQKKLLRYAKAHHIASGRIFVTRSGKPWSRCNVWREMKALCLEAGVSPEKVFPHNLRHLFARTFYGIEKDIAKLADILGHSSINTTRIYIATTGAEHRRRMEKLHLIL